MIRSDINNAGNHPADDRWEGPAGPTLVEVKRTNSMRDVRGALLASMEVEREAFAATGRRLIQLVIEPLAGTASAWK